MMRLFLLRHAKARDTWPDAERELSESGVEQIKKLAGVVERERFCNVVQIWHSPYLRAEQTARMFKDILSIGAPLVSTPTITPEDNPYETARMIASLACFDKDLMIVSHNPFLENLSDILMSGKTLGGRTVFNKCSLASFTLEDPPAHGREYGLWSIDFLISPKIIAG